VRLAKLDQGHTLGAKALFAMIKVMTRLPAPDVVKTMKYRPTYSGASMSETFQEVMRGPSEWSVADRELMAMYVSKTNECEF